ncbi:DUF6624 domain-containing protein [Flavobacterium quisquiliarum]|uniref:DUF6624 domain-containing protein n=1 Tax=Flavobacterium quisquiliarum TaxID=1834436 RepID=A0ABV8W139_9FLAO|nr:DUF6624 domain-containing protein [Flavobacterium quisquiliarum]MBW1655777.1 hypothetical protein [Flavobacterium quisquiliarum]NWL01476.1 hypothetical protein [Flavobacterium collinsii]
MKQFFFLFLLFSGLSDSKAQINTNYEELIAKASLLHLQKDYKNAIPLYRKAFALQQPDALNAYKAAGVYALDQNQDEAFKYLNISLDKGWTETDVLLIDPYFDYLRNDYDELWDSISEKARVAELQFEKTLKLPELRRQINAMTIQDQRIRYLKIQTSDSDQLAQLQQQINELDFKNLTQAKEIIKKYGWPKISEIGKDGSNNLWLLVQHADQDIFFQKTALEEMQKLTGTNEINMENFAFLYDRVQCNLNYKQLYGTQVNWTQNGEASGFRAIIDENKADERRASFGLLPLKIYALNYGFQYSLPTAVAALNQNKKDTESTLNLINEAKKYYRYKKYPKVYDNYNNASMILGGMTSSQNYEASVLFAKIYNKTKEEQYRSIALDFLSLNHLRDDLNKKELLANKEFKNFYSQTRWKDIIQSL